MSDWQRIEWMRRAGGTGRVKDCREALKRSDEPGKIDGGGA